MNYKFKDFILKNAVFFSMLAFLTIVFGCNQEKKVDESKKESPRVRPQIQPIGQPTSQPPIDKIKDFDQKIAQKASPSVLRITFDHLSDEEVRKTNTLEKDGKNIIYNLLEYDVDANILAIVKRYRQVLGDEEFKKLLDPPKKFTRIPADRLKSVSSPEQAELEQIIETLVPTQAEKIKTVRLARDLASGEAEALKKLDNMPEENVKYLAQKLYSSKDKKDKEILNKILSSTTVSGDVKNTIAEESNKSVYENIDHLFGEYQKGSKKSKDIINAISAVIDTNKSTFKVTLSLPYQNTGKTLVQNIIVRFPVDNDVYKLVLKINEIAPENFLYQVFGGDNSKVLFDCLLNKKRINDSGSAVDKIINLAISAFLEKNKRSNLIFSKNDFQRLLNAVKNDHKNLASIFLQGLKINDQNLLDNAFIWIGENVENANIRLLFKNLYANPKNEEKRLAWRSLVLVGMKEHFGFKDNKFIKEMEKYAESLGLGDKKSLDNLYFNVKYIGDYSNNSVKFWEIADSTEFYPSQKSLTFAELAKTNTQLVDAQDLKLKNLNINHVVNGLTNVGNSCYLNSLTQTLLHTPEINRLLTFINDQGVINLFNGVERPTSLLSSLAALAKNYRAINGAVNSSAWAEEAIKYADLCPGAQEDVEEFFTRLNNQLIKELNVSGTPVLDRSLNEQDQEDFEVVKNRDKAFEYSLLNKWFNNYSEQILTKDNDSKNITYDLVKVLPLAFPHEPNGKILPEITLEKMLEYHTKLEENLEDSPGNKSRQIVNHINSKILWFSFKRWHYYKDAANAVKLDDAVAYPAELILSGKTYELYSVVQQHGGVGGGHYVADIKTGGQWYHFDDSSSSKIDKETALGKNQQAYMLFYRLKD